MLQVHSCAAADIVLLAVEVLQHVPTTLGYLAV